MKNNSGNNLFSWRVGATVRGTILLDVKAERSVNESNQRVKEVIQYHHLAYPCVVYHTTR